MALALWQNSRLCSLIYTYGRCILASRAKLKCIHLQSTASDRLTACHHLNFSIRPLPFMPDISAIYVRLPNWIGDVCMSLPSLEALLDTGVPVVVCARPWARDLLQGYPLADFLPMEKNWWPNRATVRTHIRAQSYRKPVGLILPDSLSSALSFRLAGLPSAGYRDDGRSLLLRWPIAKSEQSLHAVQSWYALTRQAILQWGLGAPQNEPTDNLGLRLTEAHAAAAKRVLLDAGVEEQRFVLIAPTATGLHRGRVKVWHGFEALTQQLQAAGHKVLMCPPPGETDIAQANAPSAQLLPPLGLGAFAKLTRLASLVICNDSGVSHLAAAAQAKQLTLFGVTSPGRTGPWSPHASCLGANDQWPTVDEVCKAATDLLNSADFTLGN